jgi:hypothetical protein
MPHSFPIEFDPPRIDTVVLAVAPIDAFSGLIVTGKIKAAVDGLKDRPIRNHSGLLVFLNLPVRPAYVVRLKAEDAGYFDPGPQTFFPPPAGSPASRKRVDMLLYRKPSSPLDPDTTAVAGMLFDGVAPVNDGVVQAVMPPGTVAPGTSLRPFQTRTDASGSFVLPLRLPDDAATGPVNMRFRFRRGLTQRTLVRPVNEGIFHSFEEPINLTGANSPALLKFGS